MSYWEPDDPPELPDGCLDVDTVEQLQDLLKHVDISTRPGNRSDAALVLIDNLINPPRHDAAEDPAVTWAKTLLKDIV